jgi:hypothetical protein
MTDSDRYNSQMKRGLHILIGIDMPTLKYNEGCS